MFDIPYIIFYSFFHFIQLLCFTAQVVYLGPSRDTRLHNKSFIVFRNDITILLSMYQHMRTWTHYGHVSFKHIPELW